MTEIRKVDEFSDFVRNSIEELGVSQVIDFGCGEGALCNIFRQNGYLGLDIDENCIQKARETYSNYRFEQPHQGFYSADLCLASRVFGELSDDSIHKIMRRMRCKWVLIAESFTGNQNHGNLLPFHTRNKESYVNLMRGHDLLQVKHTNKVLTEPNFSEISLLLFKKCSRNPNL